MKASQLYALIRDNLTEVNDLIEIRVSGDEWWKPTVPATQWSSISWFLTLCKDDFEIHELRFKSEKHSCNGKVVEIDGKKYKLTEIGE